MKNCIVIPSEAREIVAQMVAKFPEEMAGRDGGHLVIQSVEEDVPFLSARIRMHSIPVSDDALKRYHDNAHEKSARLSGLSRTEGHFSSWQSRDPDSGQYGGAIEASGVTISFSGLPEHLDEYLVINLAIRFNRITDERVKQIVLASKNPY